MEKDKGKEKKKIVSDAVRRRISKAMKGNKNAEVWDDKLVIDVLNKMIDVLEQPYEIQLDSTEETKDVEGSAVVDELGNVTKESKGYTKNKVVKVNRKMHLKHDLLVMFKIRDAKWFSRMAKRAEGGSFEDNDTIKNLLEYIHKTCMSNTYNDAANGSTNSTIAKMNLSTHHQWSDRVEGKVQHEGGVILKKPEIPEDVRRAYEQANNYVSDDET